MARVALRVFWERAGQKSTAHTFQMAALVLQIGKYWAKLPEPDVETLRNMMRQLRPAHTGMSKRTEGRVRAAVEDQDRLDRLLTLPGALMDKACRAGPPGQRLAQMAQTAVLADILLHLPMRLKNLGGLRLGVHLIRGPGRSITVDIPAAETKNELRITGPLPKDVAKRMEFYIDRFRPLLNPGGTDWLFPGAVPGQPKTGEALRSQIRKAATTQCGLMLTPHDFRSLTGYLTLRDDRGAHGKVQRILGHKSLATTMAHYSGLEASMAIADYGDLMGTLRADAMARGAYRKKPRAKPDSASGGKR
jgi:integrase